MFADVTRKLPAHHETSALLDHLFWHPNTATFISRLLIQRMGSSNPSPRYVRAVAKAFRAGAYTGYIAEAAQGATAASAAAPRYNLSFSGKYGDLGAAVAAIMLDPEARALAAEGDLAVGQIREPLVKVFHYMRGLDYQPVNPHLNLWLMDSKIGEEVYESPSVFNFYLPDFTPEGPMSSTGMVSPEAMLGTEPLTLGFLNGLASLLNNGLSKTSNGFSDSTVGYLRYAAPVASNASAADHAAAVVDDLDLRLMGRRMHPTTRDVLLAQFNTTFTSSNKADATRATQMLAGAVAEFHTTSGRVPRPTERQLSPPAGKYSDRPYKAVVVIYLAGGCDSWNMLMPHSECENGNQLANDYASTRARIAVAKNDMLVIDVPNGTQPCSKMGIHPSLPTLKSLYDAGDAALFTNVGTLLEPLTKSKYWQDRDARPSALFAHNGQVDAAHLLEPSETIGILGGMAKAVSEGAHEYRAGAYSMAGSRKMLLGSSRIMSVGANGVSPFRAPEIADAIESVSRNESGSAYTETIYNIIDTTLTNTAALRAALSTANTTATFPSTSIAQQLLQITKLMGARKTLQSERDVFYVWYNGFDMHSEVVNALEQKFTIVDAAISAFVTEVKAMGLWDSVVIQSSSEFARTWAPNSGGGTDHAWGGNYFTLGGSVRAKRVHGQFPECFTRGCSLDIGNSGRIIPTSPWEAMYTPIAEWFDVNASQLTSFMPNLPNFPAATIPSRAEVFEN
eukprot:TRINITY_DN8316_c1_g1_i1.p1 TRINITY_DN8316_c1_g1~~TRINITY_DN8316_c1_g1_i1.p1  ORF type:complete len:798 (+),score=156.55 TRINITY_DN8316_c1_g1_i1:192-2396(+)